MVEYIVLATFVALAAATAVRAFGTSVHGLYDTVVGALPS
jgi:Flp pilus assembly pilin Flp